MCRSLSMCFLIGFFLIGPSTLAGKIKYNPNIERELRDTNSIVLVPRIAGAHDKRKDPPKSKTVKLCLNLEQPELYNQGHDGACAFFSTVCAMLMVETGRAHLKRLFLGQDDDFVYIKFPDPFPFGIKNIDAFLLSFKGDWHLGFDKVQFLKKSVFKVSKEIIEDHAPLSAFPHAQGWLRLLAAAYFRVIQCFDEIDAKDQLSNGDAGFQCDVFAWLPTSFPVSYYDEVISDTEIDILSGKPLLFDLDIKQAYKTKELPPVSLLMRKPIRNSSVAVHGRAMIISETHVHFFDSLNADLGVRVSSLFNSFVKREDVEGELRNIDPLLKDVEQTHEKMLNAPEESSSDHEQDWASEKEEDPLGEAFEQACFKVEQALEKRFPLHPSARPLNIGKLTQEEFILRLFAELAKKNMFKLQVLDL